MHKTLIVVGYIQFRLHLSVLEQTASNKDFAKYCRRSNYVLLKK